MWQVAKRNHIFSSLNLQAMSNYYHIISNRPQTERDGITWRNHTHKAHVDETNREITI